MSKKKHLELLILTFIRASENTASSDHVRHCKSGKTFGGWGFAPDPEWGGSYCPHTLLFMGRVKEGRGEEGAPPPVAGAPPVACD